MKKLILPLIALAALTFGIVSVVRSQPKREATAPPSPPPVSPYPHTIAAVGLVETSTENIAIGTPLSEVVSEVLVIAGQPVRPGTRCSGSIPASSTLNSPGARRTCASRGNSPTADPPWKPPRRDSRRRRPKSPPPRRKFKYDKLPLFVGQQMDVFIDDSSHNTAMTMK